MATNNIFSPWRNKTNYTCRNAAITAIKSGDTSELRDGTMRIATFTEGTGASTVAKAIIGFYRTASENNRSAYWHIVDVDPTTNINNAINQLDSSITTGSASGHYAYSFNQVTEADGKLKGYSYVSVPTHADTEPFTPSASYSSQYGTPTTVQAAINNLAGTVKTDEGNNIVSFNVYKDGVKQNCNKVSFGNYTIKSYTTNGTEAEVASFNLAKDQVVTCGSIIWGHKNNNTWVPVAEGETAGENDTMLLKLTIANGNPVYIPVNELADIYTGYTGVHIQTSVDSSNHIHADLRCGTLSYSYMDSTVQTYLSKAGTAIQSLEGDDRIGIDGNKVALKKNNVISYVTVGSSISGSCSSLNISSNDTAYDALSKLATAVESAYIHGTNANTHTNNAYAWASCVNTKTTNAYNWATCAYNWASCVNTKTTNAYNWATCAYNLATCAYSYGTVLGKKIDDINSQTITGSSYISVDGTTEKTINLNKCGIIGYVTVGTAISYTNPGISIAATDTAYTALNKLASSVNKTYNWASTAYDNSELKVKNITVANKSLVVTYNSSNSYSLNVNISSADDNQLTLKTDSNAGLYVAPVSYVISAGNGISVSCSGTGNNRSYTIAAKVNNASNVLHNTSNGLYSYIWLDYSNSCNKIFLKSRADNSCSDIIVNSISTTDFIKDGILSGASIYTPTSTGAHCGTSLIKDHNYLELTFNTDSGKQPVYVDLDQIFDDFNAGNGITINSNKIAVKAKSSNSYLTIDSNGVGVNLGQGLVADGSNNITLKLQSGVGLLLCDAGLGVNLGNGLNFSNNQIEVKQKSSNSYLTVDSNGIGVNLSYGLISDGSNKIKVNVASGTPLSVDADGLGLSYDKGLTVEDNSLRVAYNTAYFTTDNNKNLTLSDTLKAKIDNTYFQAYTYVANAYSYVINKITALKTGYTYHTNAYTYVTNALTDIYGKIASNAYYGTSTINIDASNNVSVKVSACSGNVIETRSDGLYVSHIIDCGEYN